jgi:hypothetical protein
VASHASVTEAVHATVGPQDPIAWLTAEPDVTLHMQRTWMLRVLDPFAAIAGRGFPAGANVSAVLRLADSARPAGAGLHTLTVRDGEGSLISGPTTPAAGSRARPPVSLGPRGFAALYAGVPMSTLRLAGLAAGGDQEADGPLDAAFACQPFLRTIFPDRGAVAPPRRRAVLAVLSGWPRGDTPGVRTPGRRGASRCVAHEKVFGSDLAVPPMRVLGADPGLTRWAGHRRGPGRGGAAYRNHGDRTLRRGHGIRLLAIEERIEAAVRLAAGCRRGGGRVQPDHPPHCDGHGPGRSGCDPLRSPARRAGRAAYPERGQGRGDGQRAG